MNSSDWGRCFRSSSSSEWTPCFHIRAGMMYFAASLCRAGLADGCWDANRKSWCSLSSALCNMMSAFHRSGPISSPSVSSPSLFGTFSVRITWMHFDSIIVSPEYISFTSLANCSNEIGRLSTWCISSGYFIFISPVLKGFGPYFFWVWWLWKSVLPVVGTSEQEFRRLGIFLYLSPELDESLDCCIFEDKLVWDSNTQTVGRSSYWLSMNIGLTSSRCNDWSLCILWLFMEDVDLIL